MTTLQLAIKERLLDHPTLLDPELGGGFGFNAVYSKWLLDGNVPGATPDAFNSAGRILPAIVVWHPDPEARHPSPNVPGWRKWDTTIPIYVFHWPSDHGKDVLDRAAQEIERWLTTVAWLPTITGNQRPVLELDTDTHIDNGEQFPGNYVRVLRFRVSGVRPIPNV
jgi:hypothetical protein